MNFRYLLARTWKLYRNGIAGLFLFFLVGFVLCGTIVLMPSVITGWIKGILRYISEGVEPELKELWNFENYFQILALFFGVVLFVSVAYSLLIVPGILLSVWWIYAPFFTVDKGMSFLEAFKDSKDFVSTNNFFSHLMLLLFVITLNAVGAFFLIGWLFTAPFSFILMSLAYLDIKSPISEKTLDTA